MAGVERDGLEELMELLGDLQGVEGAEDEDWYWNFRRRAYLNQNTQTLREETEQQRNEQR